MSLIPCLLSHVSYPLSVIPCIFSHISLLLSLIFRRLTSCLWPFFFFLSLSYLSSLVSGYVEEVTVCPIRGVGGEVDTKWGVRDNLFFKKWFGGMMPLFFVYLDIIHYTHTVPRRLFIPALQ
jgi:hypothetical protein